MSEAVGRGPGASGSCSASQLVECTLRLLPRVCASSKMRYRVVKFVQVFPPFLSLHLLDAVDTPVLGKPEEPPEEESVEVSG